MAELTRDRGFGSVDWATAKPSYGWWAAVRIHSFAPLDIAPKRPTRGETQLTAGPESLRVLLLNGDVRGFASFWRCWHLAQELARIGHRVSLVTVSRDRRVRPRVEETGALTVVESPNLLDLVYGIGPGFGVLGIPYRMILAARRRFDIVHAFEHRPNVTLPAFLSRALHGCPLVADWADWWSATGDGSGSQEGRVWPVSKLETMAEEFIHRKADWVTTISTVLRDRALSLGIPQGRVQVIPSGAPIDAIRPLDRTLCRRELGISPSTFLLGYVGAIARDLDLLFPAMSEIRKRHSHVKLGIVATAPVHVPSSSENAVVSFGHVPFSKLPLYLGACDAFVLPLKDSMFNRARWPNKFGDYLAAGRPILCGNVGDVAQIVEAEACGLVWSSLTELIQAIDSMIDEPSRAEAMGRAARRLAEGRLSWRNLALEFLSVYQKASALAA